MPSNAANGIKAFTRGGNAGNTASQIGNIRNSAVAASSVFPKSSRFGGVSSAGSGVFNDQINESQFKEFESHLPQGEDTFSKKADNFANVLQEKTDFTNAPRNAIFGLNPISGFANVMQGQIKPDYATAALGVAAVSKGSGLLKGATNIAGNLTSTPLQAAGDFLKNQGSKLQEKSGVLNIVGSSTAGVGSASAATGTFIKEGIVEKLAGNKEKLGVLGHVQQKAGIVGEGMGAPERFAYGFDNKDLINIPSAAIGQVGVTLDKLGFKDKAGKLVDVTGQDQSNTLFGNLKGKEAQFGDQAKGLLSKANEKVSSVIGAVAGAGAADKAKETLGNVGTGLANKNIMQTATQTAAISSIAVQSVRDVSFMSRSMENLVNMYADMKGVDAKDVSAIKAVFDPKASPSVQKARSNLIKTVGLGAVASAASAFASWQVASHVRGQQGMMLMMGMSFAQPALRGMAFKQDPLLDNYSEVRENFQKTGDLELQSVAKLITTASPTLRSTRSVDDIYNLAQHYVDNKFTPGQLMNEIDTGGIAATMFELKNEAFKANAVAHAKAELNETPKTAVQEAANEGRIAEARQQQVGS